MHGIKGASAGYAPTRPFLEALGINQSTSLSHAAECIQTNGFAYIGIESFCPMVEKLCDIRQDLGVRTVINTLARALNPLDAKHQFIGVAHPPYMPIHANVAKLLGQHKSIIVKGGGGEAQRNPLKPCRPITLENKNIKEEIWPAFMPQIGFNWRNENLDPQDAIGLWQNSLKNPKAEAAVIATAALALKQLGKATSFEECTE